VAWDVSRHCEETQDAWNLSGRCQATQAAQDAGDAGDSGDATQEAQDSGDATQEAQDAGDATQDAQDAGDATQDAQDAGDATAPYLTQGNFLLMQRGVIAQNHRVRGPPIHRTPPNSFYEKITMLPTPRVL